MNWLTLLKNTENLGGRLTSWSPASHQHTSIPAPKHNICWSMLVFLAGETGFSGQVSFRFFQRFPYSPRRAHFFFHICSWIYSMLQCGFCFCSSGLWLCHLQHSTHQYLLWKVANNNDIITEAVFIFLIADSGLNLNLSTSQLDWNFRRHKPFKGGLQLPV